MKSPTTSLEVAHRTRSSVVPVVPQTQAPGPIAIGGRRTTTTTNSSKLIKRSKKLNARNTTGYVGVYKRGNKSYQARLTINRQLISLGTYDSAKEAALVYDDAALKNRRPRSRLNFPNGLPIDDEDYDEINDNDTIFPVETEEEFDDSDIMF